jgi:hypothetical protein
VPSSPPSNSYGAPSGAPSNSYGTPSSPSGSYSAPSTSYNAPTSGSYSSFGSNSQNDDIDPFNIESLFNSHTQFSAPIPSVTYGLQSLNKELSRVPSITYGSPKGNSGDIQGSYSSISNSVSYPEENSQFTLVDSYGEPANSRDVNKSPKESFHMVQSQYNTQSPDTQTTQSSTLQRRYKESSENTDTASASNSDDKLKEKKVVVNDKLNAYLKYITKSTQKPDTGFQAPKKIFSFNYEESPSQVNDSLSSLDDNLPINHKNYESNSNQNVNAHTYSDNQWKITESIR